MWSPQTASHRGMLPALWQEPSASWWCRVCHPVWHQSTTGGGIFLTLTTGHPSGSGKSCALPRQYPCPPRWIHPTGSYVFPQVNDVPAVERAGRSQPALKSWWRWTIWLGVGGGQRNPCTITSSWSMPLWSESYQKQGGTPTRFPHCLKSQPFYLILPTILRLQNSNRTRILYRAGFFVTFMKYL